MLRRSSSAKNPQLSVSGHDVHGVFGLSEIEAIQVGRYSLASFFQRYFADVYDPPKKQGTHFLKSKCFSQAKNMLKQTNPLLDPGISKS